MNANISPNINTNTSALLKVDNLSIRFPVAGTLREVVRGVSFQVATGEILGVVGESGCGKSITNLALMGLLPSGAQISADRLELCGHNLLTMGKRDWPTIRGNTAAMIFQNPMSSLNPSLTVGTQLMESIRKADPQSDRKLCEKRAIQLLDQVGIATPQLRLKSYPHELSGGMAQRVMIAIALACHPKLLIADEPTTALDVTIQAQILDLLAQIRCDTDMAIILVSHDIGVVQRYADRIQVMYSGEIVETGATHSVTHNPAHPYTRALLQSRPCRTGVLPKTLLATIPGVVPPIDQTIVGCRFASRCDQVQDVCQNHPALTSLPHDANTSARCHF